MTMTTQFEPRVWTFPEEHSQLPDGGPWVDEPDKVQWVDETTGLDCLIRRATHGHLCGYVGVPPGHRLHGITRLDDDDADLLDDAPAHGGITFTEPCNDYDRDGVCHVPYGDRPGDVWWLGFDCGHTQIDRSPAAEKRWVDLGYPELATAFPNAQYRTVDYVKAVVAELASWVAAQS